MSWTPSLPGHAPREPRTPRRVVEVRGDVAIVGVGVVGREREGKGEEKAEENAGWDRLCHFLWLYTLLAFSHAAMLAEGF